MRFPILRISHSPVRLAFLLFFSLLTMALGACVPLVAPAVESSSTVPALAEASSQTAQQEYTKLSAVFVGERTPAFTPDWEQDFDAVARYVDWIGNGTGLPVALTDLASNTPLSAAELLESVQSDAVLRDAIAAADIVYVGAPTGDLPWVSAVDSCDGDKGDRPDWAQYTPECAATVIDGASEALNQLYAEVASLRAGQPTVLRTANQVNKVIGLFNRNADPGEVTQTMLAPWNDALCQAAEASGFVCAELHERFNGEDGSQAAEDLLYYANSQLLSDKGSETVASVLIDTGYGELVAAGARAHPFAGQDRWLAAIFDYYGAWPAGDWWAEVWLMRPDGTEAHPIEATLPHTAYKFDWSPDGTRLIASTNGDLPRIYSYDLASGGLRLAVECDDPCINDWDPAFSPDGSKIALVRDAGAISDVSGAGFTELPDRCPLVVVDLTTGDVTEIAEHIQGEGICDYPWEPDWSPYGTKIVYWLSPTDDEGNRIGSRLHVVNVDGSNNQAITDPELNASSAVWSPDGEWILFSTYSLDEFLDEAVVSNLYRVRPDGTDLEQLTFYESPDVRATTPSYSPDGNWILFTARERPGMRLWAMPAEGGEAVAIRRGSTLDWLRPELQPAPDDTNE